MSIKNEITVKVALTVIFSLSFFLLTLKIPYAYETEFKTSRGEVYIIDMNILECYTKMMNFKVIFIHISSSFLFGLLMMFLCYKIYDYAKQLR